MTLALLTAMWLTAMRTPDTPIARRVWRLTVEAPIAWAWRYRRRDLIALTVIAIAVSLLLCWIGREGAQLLAMAAPDIGAWAITFEVGTYLEAATAVLVATSAIRLKGAMAFWSARRRPPGRRPGRHRRRPRRSSVADRAANGDQDGDARRAA